MAMKVVILDTKERVEGMYVRAGEWISHPKAHEDELTATVVIPFGWDAIAVEQYAGVEVGGRFAEVMCIVIRKRKVKRVMRKKGGEG